MEDLNINSGAELSWMEYCRINEFVAVSFGNPVPDMPEENEKNLRWLRHKYRYYRFTEAGGKIASGLWSYPIPFLVGGRKVDVWSVGGISTAPEFRGRSLMNKMVSAAMRDIRRTGAPLVWLAGKRYRYGHFGFQRAGNMLELDIEQYNVERCLKHSGYAVEFFEDPAAVPWHEVKRLTAPLQFRNDVPVADYSFKCIDHKFIAAAAGRNGQREAIIVYRSAEKPVIAEYGGTTEGLSAILSTFAKKYPAFQIRIPQLDDQYFRLFLPLAERWRVDINYNLAIADLRGCLSLAACNPVRLPRGLEGERVNLTMTAGMFEEQRASLEIRDGGLCIGDRVPGIPEIALDPMTMVSALFGPVRPSMFLHSGSAVWLDLIFPVLINLQTSVHGA